MIDPDLRGLLRLHIVPRWSVIPTIRHQNVAEHSFRVAVIAKSMAYKHENCIYRGFTHAVVSEALVHDGEEHKTGDSPSPSKKKKDPSAMTDVQIVVKVADILEALLFVHEEMQMGNKSIEPLVDDLVERGTPYWDHFKWRMSDKPTFAQLALQLVEDCALCKHPTIKEYNHGP